jgi:CheY-like chemotaxis protein
MPKATFRILIVDDDPDDLELARLMLRGGPFATEFHAASDGREALAFLRGESPHEGAPRPDLILLDLNMPRMDGRELLKILKRDPKLGSIPVVIFTTSKVAEEIVSCYGLGANGFVRKPMRPEQFGEIKQVIADFRDEAVRRRARA